MKICLLSADRKFKRVLKDEFEEHMDADYKDDQNIMDNLDKQKFESGALYATLWHVFVAGIKYGQGLAKRNK